VLQFLVFKVQTGIELEWQCYGRQTELMLFSPVDRGNAKLDRPTFMSPSSHHPPAPVYRI